MSTYEHQRDADAAGGADEEERERFPPVLADIASDADYLRALVAESREKGYDLFSSLMTRRGRAAILRMIEEDREDSRHAIVSMATQVNAYRAVIDNARSMVREIRHEADSDHPDRGRLYEIARELAAVLK